MTADASSLLRRKSRETGETALAGAFVGLNILGQAVALSGLVFNRGLESNAATGTLLLILCSVGATFVLLMTRGIPALVVGAIQNAPIAVLMPVFAALSVGAGRDLSHETASATAFAVLGMSAALMGAMLIVVSLLKLERIVRLMPYPVAAGFLSSAGAILVVAALNLVTDTNASNTLFSLMPETNKGIAQLLLSIALALTIGVFARWRRDVGPVIAIFAAFLLFYGFLAIQGLTVADARNLGYLPNASVYMLETEIPTPALLAGADFETLRAALPLALAAAMIGVFGTILNLNGIELALREEIRIRRALLATGGSNILMGLFGGSISYASSVNTVSAQAFGARAPVLPYAVCVVLLIGAWFVGDIVAYTPGFVIAGLLAFVGAGIVHRWFLSQRGRQTRADWAITGAIVLVTLTFGMLPAIGLGIVAASLIFAFSYARLPVVLRVSDLGARGSAVDRGPKQADTLAREKHRVVTLTLQGFLFFGSTEQLLKQMRLLFAAESGPEVIILDFRRVSGLDSAALFALRKLEFMAASARVQIIIADAAPRIARKLLELGQSGSEAGFISFSADTDSALEAAEEKILSNMPPFERDETARASLQSVLQDTELVDKLLALMERIDLRPDEVLIRFGDMSEDIYILDQGRLSVMAHLTEGRRIRVRSLRAGALVGEIASYAGLPRTADVQADGEATVYRIGPKDLDSAFDSDPQLAAAWHRLVATTLSEKLYRTNEMLRESV